MVETIEAQNAKDSIVPHYVIDLSARPRDRYTTLTAAYKEQIRNLTHLFDDLLADLGIPQPLHRSINLLANVALRRLYSSSETDEIRGISRTAQVPMYLLVAFNVVLDLLMGCTSGAVRSLEVGQPLHESKMLHFRTLDWGMDPLRSLIVQLDFIKSKTSTGRKVLASSVTYVGFVGVLTGVRQDLSMSVNFRAVHNASCRRDHFKFYLHHVLVLLGLRQSISSLVRSYLFDESDEKVCGKPKSLRSVADEVPAKRSTAAYLTFSDGNSTVTIEKDYKTAIVRQSQSFIAITNHDLDPGEGSDAVEPSLEASVTPNAVKLAEMQQFLEESVDRRDCLVKKWRDKVRKERQRQQREAGINSVTSNQRRASTRSGKRAAQHISGQHDIENQAVEDSVAITNNEVIAWVSAWPTTNECTHFAAVLDPRVGQVSWVRRYLRPVEEPDG